MKKIIFALILLGIILVTGCIEEQEVVEGAAEEPEAEEVAGEQEPLPEPAVVEAEPKEAGFVPHEAWCSQSDFDPFLIPHMFVGPISFLYASHFYETGSWVKAILENSSFYFSTVYWLPYSEHSYDLFNISDIRIEQRLYDGDKFVDRSAVYEKDWLMTNTMENRGLIGHPVLYQYVDELPAGADRISHKMSYKLNGEPYINCANTSIEVLEETPTMSLQVLDINPFKPSGRIYGYSTSMNVSLTTTRENILKENILRDTYSGGFYIFYEKDLIRENRRFYDIAAGITDVSDNCDNSKCGYTLEVETGNVPELRYAMCESNAYLVFYVRNSIAEYVALSRKIDGERDFPWLCK